MIKIDIKEKKVIKPRMMPDKRNFFQHAGLPMDYTYVVYSNLNITNLDSIDKNIFLEWSDNLRLDTIKKWLKAQ